MVWSHKNIFPWKWAAETLKCSWQPKVLCFHLSVWCLVNLLLQRCRISASKAPNKKSHEDICTPKTHQTNGRPGRSSTTAVLAAEMRTVCHCKGRQLCIEAWLTPPFWWRICRSRPWKVGGWNPNAWEKCSHISSSQPSCNSDGVTDVGSQICRE